MTAPRRNEATTLSFIDENFPVILSAALILIGIPLLLTGRFWIGLLMVFMCFLLVARNATSSISEYDKQKIRCTVMEAKDIVRELQDVALREDVPPEEVHDKIEATLATLALKYAKSGPRDPDLPLFCQQVAYMALRRYPDEIKISSEAISMLALIAKNRNVRERHKNQADKYGLNVPIQVMQNILSNAKNVDDEQKEQEIAELQRRGCLFIGAVADEDQEFDLPLLIVEEDGLEIVLDAATWYRCHSEVSNWALWAVFVLCYGNVRNKMQLIRLDGINVVCQSLENNSDNIDVCRHGIAVLFDLLRSGQEDQTLKLDPWKIRKLALAAGLHKVTKAAMENFTSTMDIMMMGQEMLIGTGYTGTIPQYEMPMEQ